MMIQIYDTIYNKIYYYLIIVLVFFIPINQIITSYLIGILVSIWLIETFSLLIKGKNLKEKFKSLFNKKLSLIFISYYLIYLIGLTYSKNIEFGLNDLSTKLSFLIFPVIFGTIDRKVFAKQNLNIYVRSYISGCIVLSLICLGNATLNYIQTGSADSYYYTFLAGSNHPSYIAMYLSFATAFIIHYLIENEDSSFILSKIKYFVIILFFTIMIILLSSKAGIMTIISALILSLLYLSFYKKKYVRSLITLLIIVPLFYSLLLVFPFSLKRASQSENALKNKSYRDNESREGTSDRILIWKTSIELIKENPLFGVGTGDIKDVLIQKYKEKNITYALLQKMNAHNQYLQTLIATGVIGFLILILCLILPAIIAFKERDFLYFLFILIILFNLLFESMFERQAGVVFYAFFNALLFYKDRHKYQDASIKM